MLTEPARAEIGLGDVWGTAWTIGNIIVGETTLTPAYAVKSYTFHDVLTNSGRIQGDFNVTYKANRDLLGNYFYYSVRQVAGGFYPPSDQPFPVQHINKLNKTCQSHWVALDGTTNVSTSTTLETHTEVVWMAKVEQTGLWPDDGPWTVWLKTAGYKTGCNRPSASSYYWTPASIGKSGSDTVSLGTPNAILNYPFYLASDFYK